MAFCTVITCMDGRVQRPLAQFLLDRYGYDCPDTITDAGPVALLAASDDLETFEWFCRRIDISVNRHGSRHLFVVGHHDCAGNPRCRSTQEDQIRVVVPPLRRRYPSCQVTGLYVSANWRCEEVPVP